ncbi:MAG: T9SS type A sorting domain-containing protein [Ignavibacteriaceae bacterium]
MKKILTLLIFSSSLICNAQVFFEDHFDNLNNWTAIGPLGIANWELSTFGFAGGTPPELRINWTPEFNGLSRLISIPIINNSPQEFLLSFNHFCDWFSDPAPILGVAVTYDQGVTSQTIWEVQPIGGNVGLENITVQFPVDEDTFQLIIFADGYSFNIESWYVDDIILSYCLGCLTAPTNLNAIEDWNNGPAVRLSWEDNSGELGFEIFRGNADTNNIGNLFATVPVNMTSYIDTTVQIDSIYSYRVRAIYGPAWSNFSNAAIVEITIPVELLSFTSSVIDNDVILNWQTATETNNQGFQIERRKTQDERSEEWNTLGFVNGKGTTTEPQSYSFVDENLTSGKYQYRLKQIDFDGTFEYSNTVEVEINSPTKFSLKRNYPNPFNPSTSIQYSISSRQFVTLKVYDVLGKEVATLVNEEKPAGMYNVEFRMQNLDLSSGIYFYQLKAGDYIETKKMILMK